MLAQRDNHEAHQDSNSLHRQTDSPQAYTRGPREAAISDAGIQYTPTTGALDDQFALRTTSCAVSGCFVIIGSGCVTLSAETSAKPARCLHILHTQEVTGSSMRQCTAQRSGAEAALANS